MKKIIIAFILLLSITTFAQKTEWLTDYNEAAKLSIKKNKPILANFTGSDWCGWCKVLHKEVFSTPEFAKWAKKNVILLELDFPRKTKLSPDLQKQNYALQRAFGVRGYPTIWLFEPGKGTNPKQDIKPLGKTGYIRGGFEKWIASIKKYL
jgi:protein disulfide-isomerase